MTGGGRPPRPRWPLWIAALDVGWFVAVAVLFAMEPIQGLVVGSAVASMAIVGGVLMTRAPGNRVGPLLLASGTLFALANGLGAYASAAEGGANPPAAVAVASLLNEILFIPPLVLLLIGVPLIFPDGHLLSRRWRAAVWLTAAAMVALTITNLFTPGQIGPAGVKNPIGIDGIDPLLELLNAFSNLTAPIGFGAAAAAVIVRFRRGRGIERQQLKWFLAVAAISAIAFPLSVNLPWGPASEAAFIIALGGLVAMPVAIGVAILRYRLYEIDRLISRTIGYTVVTGGLILVYLAINLGLTTVFSSVAQGNAAVVAASTLVVAALFTPVRRRVQRVVDRRFDRARYDAERTTIAFAERLRDQVDLPTLADDLDATIRRSVAPRSVALWIREIQR